MKKSSKEYRIKVIQHLLKGNQIAKSGEVVTADKFINLQDSIDGGYVEEVESVEKLKTDNNADVDNDVDNDVDVEKTFEERVAELAKNSKKSLKAMAAEIDGFELVDGNKTALATQILGAQDAQNKE